MSKIEPVWEDVYTGLPALLPDMQFKWSAGRWESPCRLDGSMSKRPDRTTAVLMDNGVVLFSNGTGGNMRLEKYMQEYKGAATYYEALKLIVGDLVAPSTRSRSASPRPRSMDKKERVYPQHISQLSERSVGMFYLRSRGITVDVSLLDSLHDAIAPDRGIKPQFKNLPCIACSWTGHDGKQGGYMCIVPTYSTDGKYTGNAAKPFLSGNGHRQTGTTGGAIRVSNRYTDTVAVCEGVEDAISLMMMNGHYTPSSAITCRRYGLPQEFAGVPVWATASCSNMSNFEPPQGVHTVWICADANAPGIDSGKKLQDRLQAKGIRVHWMDTGNEEIDYNDYYRMKQNADEC